MQLSKPTEHDKAGFRSMIPADPAVVIKPMFGNLGAFVNGNMFAGLFGSTIWVRLVETPAGGSWRRSTAADRSGRSSVPCAAMSGLPADWAGQPERSTRWIEVAMSQVRALPPKAANPKAAKIPLIHWSGTA